MPSPTDRPFRILSLAEQVIRLTGSRSRLVFAQLPVDDRWAVVAYVRALQLSQGATIGVVSLSAPVAADCPRRFERGCQALRDLGYEVVLADALLAPFTPSNTARSGGTVYPVALDGDDPLRTLTSRAAP